MALSGTHDYDELDLVSWVPQKIKDELIAGGWVNIQKYRILLNGMNSFKGAAASPVTDPTVIGPHNITVVPWKGVGGSIEWSNALKTWNFWIPGTDGGGITWTADGKASMPNTNTNVEGDDESYSATAIDPDCKNPPLTIDEPALDEGDKSPAIEVFQKWALENSDGLKMEASFGNEPKWLTNGNLGIFDSDTKQEVGLWQSDHESEIKKAGGFESSSEEDLAKWEKEKFKIGYATWKVMKEAMGMPVPECGDYAAQGEGEGAASEEGVPGTIITDLVSDPLVPKQMGLATHYARPQTYSRGPKEGQLRPARVFEIGALGRTIVVGKHKIGNRPAYSLVHVKKISIGNNQQYAEVIILNESGEPDSDWNVTKSEDSDTKDPKAPQYMRVNRLTPFTEGWKPLPIVRGAPPPAGHHRGCPWPADWTELPGQAKDGYNCYLDQEGESGYGLYKTKYTPTMRKSVEGEEVKKAVWDRFYSLEEYEATADKEENLFRAVREMCYFYNKAISSKELRALVKSQSGPYSPPGTLGLHQDARPNSPVEMLAVFPQQNFDALPDVTFDKDELKEFHTSPKAVHVAYSTLGDRTSYIATQIEKHAEQIKNKFAKHSTLMFNVAKELRSFPAALTEYLLLNGVTRTTLQKVETTIELGLTDAFNLDFVLFNLGDEHMRPLDVGFDDFCDIIKDDDVIGRGMLHYLYAADALIASSKDKKFPSTEFIKQYSYPFPKIKFAESPLDPTATEPKPPHTGASKPSTPEPAKEGQKQLDKELKAKPGVGKTTAQRKKEDKRIKNPERKLAVREHRGRAIDFTGDNLVADMVYLHKNVKTVDDLYTHFLNKANVEQMAQIAVSAMMCSLSDEARERLLLAKLIANTAADCINDVSKQLKAKYPEEYEKAKKALFQEKKKQAEKGKGSPAPQPTPNDLKNKDGSTSKIKEGKAKDALSENAELTKGSKETPPEGSGDSIVGKLTPEKRAELAAEAKDSATASQTPPEPGDKLTAKDRKRILIIIANDQKKAYKIARPVLQTIIYSCIPSHELQFAIESFLQKVDAVQDGIPPVPKETPTTDLKDDKKTSDPSPGVSNMIAEGIRRALMDALMVAFILTIKLIKEAIDEKCDDDAKYGEMDGKIPPEQAEEAFGNAGIPPDMAPTFLNCLTKKLTKREMEDLFHGIISDEVKAVIKICASQVSGLDTYLSTIPEAFEHLADIVDPQVFDTEHTKAIPESEFYADPTGLLCAEDDVSPDLGPLAVERDVRKRELVKKIQDVIDDASRLIPKLPPISSDCGEDGLVPRDLPSLDKSNDMVMNAFFSGAKMAFREDANGFKDSLIVKELRDAAPGDIDYLKKDDIDQTDGVKIDSEPMATARNKKNQKINHRLGALLREDLNNAESFGVVKNGGQLDLSCKASILPHPDEAVFDLTSDGSKHISAIEQAQKSKTTLEAMKKNLEDAGGPGTFSANTFSIDQKIKKLDTKIADQEAALKEITAMADNPTAIIREYKNNTTYSILPANEETQLKDRFELSFKNDYDIDSDGLKHLPIQDVPVEEIIEEAQTYDTGAIYQEQAFSSFILQRYSDAGLKLSSAAGADNAIFALRGLYKEIFKSLMQQVARQAAASPIFEIEHFENLSFTSRAEHPLDCGPPADAAPSVDLLSLAKVQEEAKEEYEQSCESINPEEASTTALENSIRRGIVKTYIRLHMVEVLMKSVFVFSEYNVDSVLEDDLLIQYILERFKKNISTQNPELYIDILTDAKHILDERIKNGEELENLYKLDILKTLSLPTGPRELSHKEAAMKYLALEQFEDLAEKFEEVVGARTDNVHKRFLNPPENSGTDKRDKESTESGMPVQIPNSQNFGWIRMIDVASARLATSNLRFLGMDSITSSKGTHGTNHQDIRLKYPDLSQNSGTFFLERYVRVEDKLDSSDASTVKNYGNKIPSTIIAEGQTGYSVLSVLRNRIGGPDGAEEGLASEGGTGWVPSISYGGSLTSDPHLSGVVNMHDWQAFLDTIDSELDTKSPSEYFKKLKWGIRLVYVPPMIEDADTLLAGSAKYKKIHTYGGFDTETTEDWATSGEETTGLFKNAFVQDGFNYNVTSTAQKVGAAVQDALNLTFTGTKSIEGKVEHLMSDIVIGTQKAPANKAVSQKEKAFFLEEIRTAEHLVISGVDEIIVEPTPGGVAGYTTTDSIVLWAKSQRQRPICLIPLASYEEDVEIDNITSFKASDYSSDNMREKLMQTEEFKFLFNYVFPLPRMVSLLTIYSANAVALSIPETEAAFNKTKGVLKNLYYSVSPDKQGRVWWDQSTAEEETGAAKKEGYDNAISPKGSDPSYIPVAMRTVPILIRGMAEYLDPHYKFVSKLSDAGILPTGKTWLSVPIFWPVQWFGWGPPLGPWGMMAYGMPQLPGDKKKSKQAKAIETAEQSDLNIDCEE